MITMMKTKTLYSTLSRFVLMAFAFAFLAVVDVNVATSDPGSATAFCYGSCSGGCAVMGCDEAGCTSNNAMCTCSCACRFYEELPNGGLMVETYEFHNACPGGA